MTKLLCLTVLLAVTPFLLVFPVRNSRTINILLANGNGMVLVTDSRASNQFGRANDRSQKLFHIDSSTVCSIAGFGTDAGPHGTIKETAGGDISSAIEGLAQSHSTLSFRDKISAFTSLLSSRLSALETEYASAAKSGPRDRLYKRYSCYSPGTISTAAQS